MFSFSETNEFTPETCWVEDFCDIGFGNKKPVQTWRDHTGTYIMSF